MTTVQENKGQKLVGIPKDIAEEVRLKAGEEVTVLPEGKNILIKRRGNTK